MPTTTEKLQEALREIGISADNPQDFFLYDYRSPQERPIKLPRDLMLSADVDELNFLAARLEKLDAAELSELNAALTSPQSDFHSIGQIIDYPDNVDYYYEGYMDKLCTRTLYDLDGTPHVRVDEYMKRRLQSRLIRAILNSP